VATKPDSKFSGLGDHHNEQTLQRKLVPRPLHQTSQNPTNAWPLTPIFSGGLCAAERRKGRPVEALQGRNELE